MFLSQEDHPLVFCGVRSCHFVTKTIFGWCLLDPFCLLAVLTLVYVSGCSERVRPRMPLGKDELLDYDYMSDEEWEEEPEGESISVPASFPFKRACMLRCWLGVQ